MGKANFLISGQRERVAGLAGYTIMWTLVFWLGGTAVGVLIAALLMRKVFS